MPDPRSTYNRTLVALFAARAALTDYCDVTDAFSPIADENSTTLENDGIVYLELPIGFDEHGNYVGPPERQPDAEATQPE